MFGPMNSRGPVRSNGPTSISGAPTRGWSKGELDKTGKRRTQIGRSVPTWIATAGKPENRNKQVAALNIEKKYKAIEVGPKYKAASKKILQTIADALASTTSVLGSLQVLNKDVASRVKKGVTADDALDAALLEMERKGGFSSPPTIVSKILEPEEFMKFGKIPRMFHDLGVSKAHGIETHRLQWYVVIRELQKSNLHATAAQLYLEIQDTAGLWRDLFDRDLNYATGSSPETFMNYLRTNAATHFPALVEIYDIKVGKENLTDRAFLTRWWETIGFKLATQATARPVFPPEAEMQAIDGKVAPFQLGIAQIKAGKQLGR